MIKQVIRLIRPGLFLPCFAVETPQDDDILIRPRFLSICAADQRYFQGNRPPEVLAQKLPLALFHEAVGEVLHDPSGELKPGTFCVLLPCGTDSQGKFCNYKKGAFFRSSNTDGFCQEVMCLKRDEILPVPGEPAWIYVFTELISVCCQALRKLEHLVTIPKGTCIGVWGDGSMAYAMALALRYLKSECTIKIFGKHDEKLANFSFADACINIADRSDNTEVDIAFECVGGAGAQSAISQAINRLTPMGAILLMGVSENAPSIATRMILEKGLILIGSSRSTKADFIKAIEILACPDVQNSLLKLISSRHQVHSASELIDCFKHDRHAQYKTIISTLM